MKLKKLTEFLNEILSIDKFRSDSSLNGLQVEASDDTKRVAFAVDVSQKAIKKAVKWNADLLVVHHGLFWDGPAPLTGILARRVKLLLENGLSLYAAHLPLDAHPEIGNGAQLAKLIGLEQTVLFGKYKDLLIGTAGSLKRTTTVDSLSRKIARLLGHRPKIIKNGPENIKRIAIVTGGGASFAEEAGEKGYQALITGESSHASYHFALELGVSIICAGHYATETLGVKALKEIVEDECGLECRFIDVPTGL